MTKIKSPLKHKEGNASAHDGYFNEDNWHDQNPGRDKVSGGFGVEGWKVDEDEEKIDPFIPKIDVEKLERFQKEFEKKKEEETKKPFSDYVESGIYSSDELEIIKEHPDFEEEVEEEENELLFNVDYSPPVSGYDWKKSMEDEAAWQQKYNPPDYFAGVDMENQERFEMADEIDRIDSHVRNTLMRDFGTTDRHVILEELQGEDVYYERVTEGQGGLTSTTIQFENYPDLHDFGDPDINKYIYESYAKDYGTDWVEDIALGLDWMGLETLGGDMAKSPWEDPNSDYFKSKFFSKYTDST
tara:strand:+ start:105 stop:1001 length:897 start_codon:yes stop_codon:yes gene_type:complete